MDLAALALAMSLLVTPLFRPEKAVEATVVTV